MGYPSFSEFSNSSKWKHTSCYRINVADVEKSPINCYLSCVLTPALRIRPRDRGCYPVHHRRRCNVAIRYAVVHGNGDAGRNRGEIRAARGRNATGRRQGDFTPLIVGVHHAERRQDPHPGPTEYSPQFRLHIKPKPKAASPTPHQTGEMLERSIPAETGKEPSNTAPPEAVGSNAEAPKVSTDGGICPAF
jgi:hypothetical protein